MPASREKASRWINAVFLAAIGCHVAGCTCEESQRVIKIILPNDFRGEFTIVKDSAGSPISQRRGVYIYAIPPSGELRTPDIEPFFRWHQLQVEFADGRVIVDYSRDLHRNHGVKIEDRGTSPGVRIIEPGQSEGSAEYEGSTLRWEVVEVGPTNSGNK